MSLKIRGFKHGGIDSMHRVSFEAKSIENAFLPLNALISLRNGPGLAEAEAVVKLGDQVLEGQLLARSTGANSSNMHSSIPGIVRRITQIKDAGSFDSLAIKISLDGSFSVLGKRPERYRWKALNKGDIGYLAQDKGVVRVSTGEPLYPALSKMSVKQEYTLILNVLELDPYSRVEESLFRLRTMDVLDGCAIAARISKPSRIIIAIDERYSAKTLSKIREAIDSCELDAKLQLFKHKIPQDHPRQLALALGINKDDIFIVEPSSLISLHEAIVSNKPHIEQYVFVGGGAIKHPAVLKARIGSPIGDLIEECGGFTSKPYTIVLNNPFTGRAAPDLDCAVGKTTRAILALTESEAKPAPERPCIRCSDCYEVCPAGLKPFLLHKLIQLGKIGEAKAIGLDRCISCGACAYICSSRIALVSIFDTAKKADKDRGQN